MELSAHQNVRLLLHSCLISNNSRSFIVGIFHDKFSALTVKRFLVHIALIFLVLFLVLYVTMCGVKSYTNHGQQLVLPDYIDKSIDFAIDDAKNSGHGFEVIVNDSIHRLGIPGGQILNQNPKPNSKVKESRKIYVTIAKYAAELFKSEYLGTLYGEDFNMKSKELRNVDIFTEVVDRQYDRGQPGMILKAYYKGRPVIDSLTRRTIEGINIKKGETIKVVLSKNDGGQSELPNLVCKQISIARFLLKSSRLNINIAQDADVVNLSEAYIYKQEPSIEDMSYITMGETVVVYASKEKPSDCP